jgi:hypothetical protein
VINKKGMGMGTIIAIAIALAFLALIVFPGVAKAWKRGRGSNLAGKFSCPKLCGMRASDEGDWAGVLSWEILSFGEMASESALTAGIDIEDCCCGSSGDEGKMLHIMLHANKKEIWEFHLTNHDPETHSKYEVPDMFNHKNSCDVTGWSGHAGEGCLIFAVEMDGDPLLGSNDDDCALFVAENGTVINGSSGEAPTLWEEEGVSKVEGWTESLGGEERGVWNDLYSQEPVDKLENYCGDNRKACQKYLLSEPTCNLPEKNFELYNPIECKYNPITGEYKWKVLTNENI